MVSVGHWQLQSLTSGWLPAHKWLCQTQTHVKHMTSLVYAWTMWLGDRHRGTWDMASKFNAFVLSPVSVRLLWYICYVLDKAFYVTQYWGDCSPIYCHQKVEQYRCFRLLFVEHICPPCSSFLFIIGQTFLLHHKCKPKIGVFGNFFIIFLWLVVPRYSAAKYHSLHLMFSYESNLSLTSHQLIIDEQFFRVLLISSHYPKLCFRVFKP